MKEYFPIGKIAAAHGLKGELLLLHELGKKTSLKGLSALFTEEKNKNFLPWFIESVKIKSGSELFLKLEGVDSREAAMKLVRKKAWVTADDFKKFAARSAPAGLLGYQVIDGGKPLGPVLEIIEQPQQLLCRLQINGKDVFIPLHEASLQQVDHKKKELRVELPEGLLDVYLK